MDLYDFKRNVNCWDTYDENSFVGKWYNHSTWSDKEYWKLENDLILIGEMYPYPENIPRDILIGIDEINRFMVILEPRVFEVLKEDECYVPIDGYIPDIDKSIYASNQSIVVDGYIPDVDSRYERYQLLIQSIFRGEDIRQEIMDYMPPS